MSNQKPLFGFELKKALNDLKYDIEIKPLIEKAKIREECWDTVRQIWGQMIEEMNEGAENVQVDVMMIDSVYVSKDYRT